MKKKNQVIKSSAKDNDALINASDINQRVERIMLENYAITQINLLGLTEEDKKELGMFYAYLNSQITTMNNDLVSTEFAVLAQLLSRIGIDLNLSLMRYSEYSETLIRD